MYGTETGYWRRGGTGIVREGRLLVWGGIVGLSAKGCRGLESFRGLEGTRRGSVKGVLEGRRSLTVRPGVGNYKILCMAMGE